MYKTFSWILLLSVLVSTRAVVQQIQFFLEPNQSGNSIILAQKHPDLQNWKFFLNNAQSYCVIGIWDFFPLTNYQGFSYFEVHGDGGTQLAYEQRRCANFSDFGAFNSARYRGPADTRAIGISIYEGTMNYDVGGTEVVVEGRAETNFDMNKTVTIISHGRSNWTLFTEVDFEGTSSCFRSNGNIYRQVNINSTNPVRSVVRDCNFEKLQ